MLLFPLFLVDVHLMLFRVAALQSVAIKYITVGCRVKVNGICTSGGVCLSLSYLHAR